LSGFSNQDFNNLAGYFTSSKFKEGEIKAREYLAQYPNNIIILNILGVFLLRQKDLDQAESILRKTIAIDPTYAEAYCNLGLTLQRKKFLRDAEKCFNEAIKKNPNLAYAYNNLGVLYKEIGEDKKALENYKLAIQKEPSYFEAYNNLGIIQHKLDLSDEAIQSFEKCISINSDYAEAYNNLGSIYAENKKDYHTAIFFYKRAIDKNSTFEDAIHNLGNTYALIYNFDEAFKYLNIALKIDPKFSMAWNTLGMTYYKIGDLDNAEKFYKKSIEVDALNTDARFNLGVLYLRLENYKDGWKEREAHRDKKGFFLNKKYPDKLWKGEYVKGTLFVWREQGIGDEILFLSMFCDLTKYADNIILEIDTRLQKLLRNFLNKKSIKNVNFKDYVPNPNAKADIVYRGVRFNKHISIGSMGCFLRESKEKFKNADHPYLMVDDDRNFKFKLSNHVDKQKFIVGITWKTLNKEEGWRNLSLENISKIISSNSEINFVNLQFGCDKEEVDFLSKFENFYNIPNLNLKNDIYSVSEIIKQLDLVLTIQNAVAHLSCALGKETWVMLTTFPRLNWGKLDDGYVSDWYPSAKSYRQKKINIWTDVINKVVLDLAKSQQAK